MRPSKIPPVDRLQSYVNDRSAAAKSFNVTEKTVIRWMKHYKLYVPTKNYGCNKLNMDKAREIRQLHKTGKSVGELVSQFLVTPSAIGRIIHNITYYEPKDVAVVSVIYNHSPASGTRGG